MFKKFVAALVVALAAVCVAVPTASATTVAGKPVATPSLIKVGDHTRSNAGPCYSVAGGSWVDDPGGSEFSWLYLEQTLWCSNPGSVSVAAVNQSFDDPNGNWSYSNSGWGGWGAPESTGQNRHTHEVLTYVPYGNVWWQRQIALVTASGYVWATGDPNCTYSNGNTTIVCNYGHFTNIPHLTAF